MLYNVRNCLASSEETEQTIVTENSNLDIVGGIGLQPGTDVRGRHDKGILLLHIVFAHRRSLQSKTELGLCDLAFSAVGEGALQLGETV